jgi:hypothetical protein
MMNAHYRFKHVLQCAKLTEGTRLALCNAVVVPHVSSVECHGSRDAQAADRPA